MHEPVLAAISGGVAGFQAAISESYFPLDVELVDFSQEFSSAGAVARLGPLRLSRTYVSGAFRSCRRVRRRDDDRNTYVLMLLEEGGDVCLRGGRGAVTTPGDLVLMNADQPLETEQKAGGISLAVSIPAPLIKARYAELDDWCLIPVSTTAGAPAILREYLLSYWRAQSALHPAELGDFAACLLHLIRAAFRSREDLPLFDSPSMQAHFLRIRDTVAQHLESSCLTAEFISDQLGISKSYLFMIMNAADTTLGRFILEQRLRKIRELLADPALKYKTVTEIAFSTGFQELSHFSRRFTERYGQSPRAFRAGALQSAEHRFQ
jgi:AraC-like DNA-binding protein